jgi:hypothetical protein
LKYNNSQQFCSKERKKAEHRLGAAVIDCFGYLASSRAKAKLSKRKEKKQEHSQKDESLNDEDVVTSCIQ